jgi:hypothetical protein
MAVASLALVGGLARLDNKPASRQLLVIHTLGKSGVSLELQRFEHERSTHRDHAHDDPTMVYVRQSPAASQCAAKQKCIGRNGSLCQLGEHCRI